MNKLKSDLIRKLLHAGATDRAARALERLKPADVADLFGALSPGEIVTMVNVLFRSNRAAKTLAALPSDYLPPVLQELHSIRYRSVSRALRPELNGVCSVV